MLDSKGKYDSGVSKVDIMSILLNDINESLVFVENKFHKSNKQWSEELKSNLIVSIFNDYRFPPIVFATINHNGVDFRYVIDGTQRLKTFLEFKNNNFKISDSAERAVVIYYKQLQDQIGAIPEEYDLRGKFYKDLPEELQLAFDGYNVSTDVYSPCTEEDIAFHIKRYNSTK